jgi:mannose-6-phosphate isomerase-like protein (cupin superfamily)
VKEQRPWLPRSSAARTRNSSCRNCALTGTRRGAGRRAHVEYRNFGIGEATGDQLHFVGARIPQASDITTGWHYHTCELLVAYYVKGWIDVYFELGELVRLEGGSCICFPKGMPHNEFRNSEDMQLVEFYIGEMGTVNCDEPAPGQRWSAVTLP